MSDGDVNITSAKNAIEIAIERVDAAMALLSHQKEELISLRDRFSRAIHKDVKAYEHIALDPETYIKYDLEKICDILVDYIRGVKYEDDLRMLSPNSTKLPSSPIGWLWSSKIRRFCKDTDTSVKIINPEELLRSIWRKQITYPLIVSKQWIMNNDLLLLTENSEFIDYFEGGATIKNADRNSMLKARYILMIELIRFSVVDDFESGRTIGRKITDINNKGVINYITPAGVFNSMRYTKDGPKKSVKLERFKSYLYTRIKENKLPEKEKSRSAYQVEMSAPLLLAPYTLTISPDMPRNSQKRPLVGSAIQSRVSRTPPNSQDFFSGFYAVRIQVINDKKKSWVFRIIEAYRSDIQRERGVILGEVKYRYALDRNPELLEEWSYEDWLSMNPTRIKDETIAQISRSVIEEAIYKSKEGKERLRSLWQKGQK